MNEISQKQSELTNIKKLAAQRKLYNCVKKVQVYNFLLTVIFTIILNFINQTDNCNNSNNLLYFPIVLISLLVQFIPFNYLSKKLKLLAASIQQNFDHVLYDGFELYYNKPITREDVERAISKYDIIYRKNNTYDELTNWYSNINIELSPEIAFFKCQKQNSNWDNELRKKYNMFLVSMLVLLLCALLITSFVINDNFRNTFLYICLPFSPLILYLSKAIIDNTKCLFLERERNKSLSDIGILLENENIDEESIKKLIASLQKDIYEYRYTVLSIPDFFYKIFKKEQQDIINNIENV
ncbi:hypothetical protein FACS189461_2600 [Spirochaetia bacterium]|nr:hypothetical protein FACS189461_2600 [Spirochaetia bacterium]